ncbi:AAA family ATPase [Micromonospora sp. NPDC049662]|uniref:AAA family ATPase n=1 Tax=Micromonospora sp. NPDC049662 TaxID=3155397 RepID=UPI0034207753
MSSADDGKAALADQDQADPAQGSIAPADQVEASPADRDHSALIVLVGAAGSGKSTYARRHYRAIQVYSLDTLRAVASDDECDQDATADAVALMLTIVDMRLSRRLTTVVDATNGVPEERAHLIAIATRHAVPAVAVVLDTDLQVCLARQDERPGPKLGQRWGRAVPASVVQNQHARMRASIATLRAEGFAQVHLLSGPARADQLRGSGEHR